MAIFDDPQSLDILCRRWKVVKLSLFGSRLKGTSRPESDIDLLVEFEPGGVPGLMGISRLELDLSKLAGGAKIDLRPDDALRLRHMREAAEQALVFVDGRVREDLDCDTLPAFALARALEIIGEAATKAAPETRREFS